MSKSGNTRLFDLYERLDRLEELIEDMEELGISTREEAEQMIVERYSLEAVLPQMLQLYEDAKKIPIPYADVAPRPKPPPQEPPQPQRLKPPVRPMISKPRSPFRG